MHRTKQLFIKKYQKVALDKHYLAKRMNSFLGLKMNEFFFLVIKNNLRIHAIRHLINFIGSQIQQVFLIRQQLKMLKILLIMILFIFGVFAQTACQNECVSPYKYKPSLDKCCLGSWSGNNCHDGLCDPAGQGNCPII
ncbi:hypothetical protein pb186bvf_001430 [Paramecium bursaria]